MNQIFKCPKCENAFSLPTCSCNYIVKYKNRIYQFTDDPYIVKDDSADVKYIGYEDIGDAYSGEDVYKMMTVDERHIRIAEIISDGTLLDLACGDGIYTVPLLQCGIKIIAMDISDKMLSLLYKRVERSDIDVSNLIVCRANALDIPLLDNSIDAVIANSVLHLISKPDLVVKEIFRVLKKGGKYITQNDHPSDTNIEIERLSLTEKAENEKYDEMVGFVHRRYFHILKVEYGILGTRYSWSFCRESICDELFERKETISIPINNKKTNVFKDTFLYRMGKKGFSDQSDVPQDIHTKVFCRVMAEFSEKYGDRALNAVSTEYKSGAEIIVFIK